MTLPHVRANVLLELDVFVDLSLKRPVDSQPRDLLVEFHDLRFRQVFHPHLGVDADPSTDLPGGLFANTKDGILKPKPHLGVVPDVVTEDVHRHGSVREGLW